jgi:outer membrane receptor protein involved in Fe transport
VTRSASRPSARRHDGAGLLSGAILLSASASAQDTAPPAADPQPSLPGDIVVTALHRASTVQTTPLSIAALSGETLAKTGATQLADYFRQVPNLNVTSAQGGSSRISIRGVNAAGEATVGLYYDETPVTGPSGTTQDSGGVAADMNLFDVERVEVLRGPQGTLYGASSMAGTLRIIFNKPNSKKYEAATEEQVSTTAHGGMGYFFKGMVNAPIISDKLAVRVVGYEKRPGWIDNVLFGTKDVNDSSNWGVRGLIGYTPDDKTTITGTVTYQKSTAKDQQGWYPSVGLYQTNSPTQLPFDSKMQLYNLKGDRALGFATLTATASYYKYQFLRALISRPARKPMPIPPRPAPAIMARRPPAPPRSSAPIGQWPRPASGHRLSARLCPLAELRGPPRLGRPYARMAAMDRGGLLRKAPRPYRQPDRQRRSGDRRRL